MDTGGYRSFLRTMGCIGLCVNSPHFIDTQIRLPRKFQKPLRHVTSIKKGDQKGAEIRRPDSGKWTFDGKHNQEGGRQPFVSSPTIY